MGLRTTLFNRLRDEGRWEFASQARMEERERLRAAGLTRRAANEQSWAWLEENYPALTADQRVRHKADTLATMACFPPRAEGLDGAKETSFAAFWWVYFHLLAWENQEQAGHQENVPRYVVMMLREAPDAESVLLGATALGDLRSFFQRWRRKLLAVLDRWQVKPPEDEVYQLEVAWHLDAFESLILAFPRPSQPAMRKSRVASGRQ